MAMAPLYSVWLAAICVFLCRQQNVTAFAGPRSHFSNNIASLRVSVEIGANYPQNSSPTLLSSSPNDDDNWGLEDSDEDPRLQAMRSMLESSWDGEVMGTVPTNPEKGAEAASECVADAMRQNKNVLMVDLRLPTYDITEGSELYDSTAAYDFCSFLSDKLREKNLIRKSLILVRNEKERAEIDLAISERDGQTTISDDKGDAVEETDDFGFGGESGEGSEVDDFRKQLMTSWDSAGDDTTTTTDEGSKSSTPPVSAKKLPQIDNSSHRLWSMIGNKELSTGPDMFDQVIAAVDQHSILQGEEDALIILSPYDTADIIALRRIMARYGQTRTIVIVNSRMEPMPRELAPAVLVYGILPLIAMSRQKEGEAGLKALVMKRFPADWAVYVDVYGDGFVEATGSSLGSDGTDKDFPSPAWIAQRVQAHVEGLSKKQ